MRNNGDWTSCESILEHSDIGEKLAHKLRKLEEEKMQLERERAHETKMQQHQDETMRMNDENMRMQENTEEILHVQQQKQEMTMQQMIEGDEMKMREEEQQQQQLRIHDELLEKDRRSVVDIRRQEDIRLKSMEKQEVRHFIFIFYSIMYFFLFSNLFIF